MLKSVVSLGAVCTLVVLAPLALADDDPPPAPPAPAAPVVAGVAAADGPPPDTGIVGSGEPGVVTTLDGSTLTVAAKDETQLPIPPLTTALSSREYLAGATFTGSVKGGSGESSSGTLEVGYQIGCGITLSTTKLIGSVGLNATVGTTGLTNVGMPLSGQFEVDPQAGEVINVTVFKKKYKGNAVRVTVKDVHIKIDGCIGQSFIRSYAILTSSSKANEDIVAYYGITKAV
jgi:hypothetical protein